jgi:hypothetical protein
MSPNQHESVERTLRYARHITELAGAFRVKVSLLPPGAPPHEAAAGFVRADRDKPAHERRRCIVIPPVTDETTYAAALHELGHCLSPTGHLNEFAGSRDMVTTNRMSTLRDVRLKLEGERSAWTWAKHYALEWTPVMDALANDCMDSYLKLARRFGVKEERW